MRRRTATAAVAGGVLAGVAVLTGCSGSSGEVTAKAERVLAPKVQQVRDVAATGSYAQLQRVVAQLKRLVAQERVAGQVSNGRAADIDNAADRLLVDAAPTERPTPTPSVTPSATPTPTPTPSPTPSPSASPTPTQTSSQQSSSTPGSTVTIGAAPPG
jgi:hypothetical protein